MTDVELGKWLPGFRYNRHSEKCVEVVDALVALLREADSYIQPSYVQGGVIAFKARLRAVLGERE